MLMQAPELTGPEASPITMYRQMAPLTERFVNYLPEATRAVPTLKIVEIPVGNKVVGFEYLDDGYTPACLMPLLRGFANVISLPDNWDGEGAAKVDREAINQALAAVNQLLDRNTPAPSLVPTLESGVQMEWHRRGKDLEIEFYPDGRKEFYYFDEATQEEHEGPVGSSFSFLRKYLERLS